MPLLLSLSVLLRSFIQGSNDLSSCYSPLTMPQLPYSPPTPRFVFLHLIRETKESSQTVNTSSILLISLMQRAIALITPSLRSSFAQTARQTCCGSSRAGAFRTRSRTPTRTRTLRSQRTCRRRTSPPPPSTVAAAAAAARSGGSSTRAEQRCRSSSGKLLDDCWTGASRGERKNRTMRRRGEGVGGNG